MQIRRPELCEELEWYDYQGTGSSHHLWPEAPLLRFRRAVLMKITEVVL